jgi:predicted DsbA family dithiol-disulfide isomerase
LIAHAQSVSLDVQAFSTCLASNKFKAAVEADLRSGAASGVTGTPAFFGVSTTT